MKFETYINAMLAAYHMRYGTITGSPSKRFRQYWKFRTKVVRLNERNKMEIANLKGDNELLKICLDECESEGL